MEVPMKTSSVKPHRRRMSGIFLLPERPASVNSEKRSSWRPLKDPLEKRSPKPRYPVENGFRRGIRLQLIEASERDDREAIEESIHMFEKNRLEDKGELAQAREKLLYLNLRKGLIDAIHRRRIDLLDKAIADVRDSKFVSLLDPFPLRKASNLRDELSCLDRFNQPVLLLNQRTITELRRYGTIPDVIKKTMAAAFLLLGENSDDLKEWDFIRGVLGRLGNGCVRLKMEHFNPAKVSRDTALKAESLLKTVTIDSVRQASSGCAAFFLWTQKAIAKVKGDNCMSTLQKNEI